MTIEEAVKILKEKSWLDDFRDTYSAIGCLIIFAESVLDAPDEWPKVKKAHTYGSENADIYRAYDRGQKDMLERCLRARAKEKAGDRQ